MPSTGLAIKQSGGCGEIKGELLRVGLEFTCGRWNSEGCELGIEGKANGIDDNRHFCRFWSLILGEWSKY